MPKIPTFQAALGGGGPVRFTSGGQGPDLSGLQQGLRQVAGGIEQHRENTQIAFENERRQMEAERKASDHATATAESARLQEQIADTAEEIGNAVLDGSLPRDNAATEFRTRLAQSVDAAVEKIPEEYRERVRSALSTRTARMERVIVEKAVRAKTRSDTEAAIDQTLEYLSRSYGREPVLSTAQAVETIDMLGPHAGWSAATISKKKQAFIEAGALSTWTQRIGLSKTDNKALTVLDKELQADPNIDPQRKAALTVQIADHQARNEQRQLVAAQRAEIASARREREATSAWNVMSDLVMAGKMPDAATTAAYAAKLKGTPYEKALPELLKQVTERTAAAMQSLPEQRSQLAGLYAQRNTSGTNPGLEAEIKRREEVLKASESDYSKEPLFAGVERGIIPAVAPINGANLDTLTQSIGQRVQQAQVMTVKAGKPVSPLLADEARQVGDALMALNPAQRAEKIAKLSATMPPDQARALAGQIEGKDRALALQFAAGMSQTTMGRFTSELIARGAQAVKDRAVKEDNAAMVGVKAQVSEFIGESLTGKAREDVIDAARYIYLAQQAEGSGADVRRAVRLAIGGDIVEHNGKRIPVPAGVDDLRAKLRAIPLQSVAAQATDGQVYLPGAGPMPLADFMARLPDAVLEPAGMGRYAVRAGGALAVNKAGRPIVIEVR